MDSANMSELSDRLVRKSRLPTFEPVDLKLQVWSHQTRIQARC
jgi:hypothetical protein